MIPKGATSVFRDYTHRYFPFLKQQITNEIDSEQSDYLLNVDAAEYCQHLYSKYKLNGGVEPLFDTLCMEPLEETINFSNPRINSFGDILQMQWVCGRITYTAYAISKAINFLYRYTRK
jgi:hypothetical protein